MGTGKFDGNLDIEHVRTQGVFNRRKIESLPMCQSWSVTESRGIPRHEQAFVEAIMARKVCYGLWGDIQSYRCVAQLFDILDIATERNIVE